MQRSRRRSDYLGEGANNQNEPVIVTLQHCIEGDDSPAADQGVISLDVVICTHNRASALERVLAALAEQRPAAGLRWSVLVVDNASTDHTPQVAAAHRARGELNLRYVREPTLGLTPARLRGAQETAGEWVAFVDDDNVLDPGWLEAMAAAIREHPDAGAFGGRVVLHWAKPPPAAGRHFGFCFAEQELGDTAKEVDALVGAGLVLKRSALEASGWTQRPLLADRIGRRLVSGGDAEISQRVRGAGFELRYAPAAVMRHEMPPQRSTFRYLVRIARSLGESDAHIRFLGWPGGEAEWRTFADAESGRRMRQALNGLWWSLRTGRKLAAAAVWLALARGFAQGVRQLAALPPDRRQAMLGAAWPGRQAPEGNGGRGKD